MKTLLITAIGSIFFNVSSFAAVTLDQDQQTHNSTYYGFGVGMSLAQTFTVGVSGQLSQVRIQMSPVHNQMAQTTVSIFGTTLGDIPSGPALWSQSFSSLNPNWFVVNMMGPNVSIGQIYAIVLTSTDPAPGGDDNSWVAHSSGNPYINGKLFQNTGSGWVETGGGLADATFQTYVSPIPETSSALLGSLGILVLLRRRR